MTQPAIQLIPPHEYLLMERQATERHEYFQGEVFAMSGASLEHNIIEDNLRVMIGSYLKGKSCRSFGSNLRVHIPSNSLYTYPDVLIVCGEPVFEDDVFDTLLNPSVLMEILSPSMADYDRGAKWNLYREIESLKEYFLIDSATTHVVQYVRNNDSTWTLKEMKQLHQHFTIQTIGLQLLLADVYEGALKPGN